MKRRLPVLLSLAITLALPAAAEVSGEGVIRGIDRDNNTLTIDELSYRGLYTTLITGHGDGATQAHELRIGDPVRFELDIDGRLQRLWVYPRNSEQRAEYGYAGDQNRD